MTAADEFFRHSKSRRLDEDELTAMASDLYKEVDRLEVVLSESRDLARGFDPVGRALFSTASGEQAARFANYLSVTTEEIETKIAQKTRQANLLTEAVDLFNPTFLITTAARELFDMWEEWTRNHEYTNTEMLAVAASTIGLKYQTIIPATSIDECWLELRDVDINHVREDRQTTGLPVQLVMVLNDAAGFKIKSGW